MKIYVAFGGEVFFFGLAFIVINLHTFIALSFQQDTCEMECIIFAGAKFYGFVIQLFFPRIGTLCRSSDE